MLLMQQARVVLLKIGLEATTFKFEKINFSKIHYILVGFFKRNAVLYTVIYI